MSKKGKRGKSETYQSSLVSHSDPQGRHGVYRLIVGTSMSYYSCWLNAGTRSSAGTVGKSGSMELTDHDGSLTKCDGVAVGRANRELDWSLMLMLTLMVVRLDVRSFIDRYSSFIDLVAR